MQIDETFVIITQTDIHSTKVYLQHVQTCKIEKLHVITCHTINNNN